MSKNNVPISEKVNLSLEEAASYFNIGIGKLREITNSENCPYVLWIGNKRLIKRNWKRFLMRRTRFEIELVPNLWYNVSTI